MTRAHEGTDRNGASRPEKEARSRLKGEVRQRILFGMAGQRESGFDDLSVAERILVVQDLWDRISERPDDVELTDAQRAELDRRLRAHRDDPDGSSTWQDVAERIRSGR